MIMRSRAQKSTNQDAGWICDIGRPSNRSEVQVLMGAVEAMEPPPSCLSTACPTCKAPSVQILAPMGRHHDVRDAAVEPPKASMLDFRVNRAPALAQSGQTTCQRHEGRVHRDHAEGTSHLTPPLPEVTDGRTNAPLAAPSTHGTWHPHGAAGREMAVALFVHGPNLCAFGQQEHVVRAAVPDQRGKGPHVCGMVEDPTRRHRRRWRQRHIAPPT